MKKAVVLMAVCADNEKTQKSIAVYCTNGLLDIDTEDLLLDFQFLLVYQLFHQRLPAHIGAHIGKLFRIIADDIKNCTDKNVLSAFLLLSQLRNQPTHDYLFDTMDSLPDNRDGEYLFITKTDFNQVVAAIQIDSCFGLKKLSLNDKHFIPILEIRLLAALTEYDIGLTCSLMQSLYYCGIKKSFSLSIAEKFLLTCQAEDGFFGSYDREFKILKRETIEQQLDYLLSSSLAVVLALSEQNPRYRYHCRLIPSYSKKKSHHKMSCL